LSQVLADPELDRRLARDGFATFRVLSREAAAALRGEVGRLRGWQGSGFCSDLVVDDAEYRRQVNDVIGATADRPVTDAFLAHEPFLHNFLVKFPGAESGLYVHQDWMYVDERRGDRTFVAWIALEDIVGHNGQLQVLRGSHLLPRSPRGTGLIAEWLQQEDAIRERLIAVPLEAGECVVFDNALVHASFPNHTTTPRAAAAVGLGPRGVPLVHFRREGDGAAVRYDVDPDFFCTHTPQGLLEEPPQLEVREHVDLTPSPLPDLASRLDRSPLARLDRARYVASSTRTAVAERWARTASGARALVERSPRPRIGERAKILVGRSKRTARALRAKVVDLPSLGAMGVLRANERPSTCSVRTPRPCGTTRSSRGRRSSRARTPRSARRSRRSSPVRPRSRTSKTSRGASRRATSVRGAASS
jgi:hypothetical protein